ncbi:MAG: hypothetical protein ACAI25_20085 [Planctomycetota bacterium]
MSTKQFVEAAQEILGAAGFKTTFTTGGEVVMYRHEALDRHIEVVIWPERWSVSGCHVASGKSRRVKGRDVPGLTSALRQLCAEEPFEPAVGDKLFRG